MNFNPEIFKAYDIRGLCNHDFDEEFAFALGAALVNFIGKKNFLVAHDDRSFSSKLAVAFSDGITSAGADVQFLGLATTPFFNFVFSSLGVNGGAMVTASHLGPEFGGFKVFGEKGATIALNSGLEEIKNIILKNVEHKLSKYGGKKIELNRRKLLEQYAEFLIKKSGWSISYSQSTKFKIVLPPVSQFEKQIVLEKARLKENLSENDLSFEFDSDADRIYVFDSAGRKIRPDYITALLAKDEIKFLHKPKVVHDLRFSRGVLEKFSSWGVKTIRSKTGRTFMRQSMVKHDGDIGGELSGHIFFKNANYNEMPFITMLRILKIIKKTGNNINELVEQFETWHCTPSDGLNFEFSISKFGELAARLKEKYKDGKNDELDGITIEYRDWWFNLRPSNTEPLLRLVVEAKTKNLLDEKVSEIIALKDLLL